MAGKYGMQSLGTDGETQTHAILKPTLTAVPSLLYLHLLAEYHRSDTQAFQLLERPARRNDGRAQ